MNESTAIDPPGTAGGEDRPAPHQPRKSLTLKSARLMGSPRCLNCGTHLQGPYCHYCGQPDKNLLRFFPALMREFMEDFLELDTRFSRTMIPLLFIPGKLTRDYLDGRRFRYTPPLRLYIFSSMAFFLLAATLAGDAVRVFNVDNPGAIHSDGFNVSVSDEDELKRVRDALEKVDPDIARKMDEEIAREAERAREAAAASSQPGDESEGNAGDASSDRQDDATDTGLEDFVINGKPWDRETNPFVIPWMPGFVNDWINEEIEQSPQKGKEIEANPNLIVEKIFDVLPIVMFVLLPVVALLFKFWYLFSGKYYVEHLIHAMHNHAFLFVMLLLSLVVGSLANWREPGGEGAWSNAAVWFQIGISVWIPIYLLISLKRVYRQNWFFTLIKYGLVGISYVMVLALGTAAAALASFVLL